MNFILLQTRRNRQTRRTQKARDRRIRRNSDESEIKTQYFYRWINSDYGYNDKPPLMNFNSQMADKCSKELDKYK